MSPPALDALQGLSLEFASQREADYLVAGNPFTETRQGGQPIADTFFTQDNARVMNSAKSFNRSSPPGKGAAQSDVGEAHLGPQSSRSVPLQWTGHMCVDDVATSGPEIRATLSATEAALTLKGTLGEFSLPAEKVDCVKRAGFYPWFWGGIRFYHKVNGLPKRLQFCPMGLRSRQILTELRSRGFNTA